MPETENIPWFGNLPKFVPDLHSCGHDDEEELVHRAYHKLIQIAAWKEVPWAPVTKLINRCASGDYAAGKAAVVRLAELELVDVKQRAEVKATDEGTKGTTWMAHALPEKMPEWAREMVEALARSKR